MIYIARKPNVQNIHQIKAKSKGPLNWIIRCRVSASYQHVKRKICGVWSWQQKLAIECMFTEITRKMETVKLIPPWKRCGKHLLTARQWEQLKTEQAAFIVICQIVTIISTEILACVGEKIIFKHCKAGKGYSKLYLISTYSFTKHRDSNTRSLKASLKSLWPHGLLRRGFAVRYSCHLFKMKESSIKWKEKGRRRSESWERKGTVVSSRGDTA